MLTKAQLQGPEADAALAAADIQGAVIRGATQAYGDKGIRLLSEGAWVRVRNMLEDDPSLLGKTTTMWLSAESNLDLIAKGKMPESAAPEAARSEEHTSELQSLMRISYAVFSLKKKQHISQSIKKPRISAPHTTTR